MKGSSLFAFLLLISGSGFAQYLDSPPPGSIYREYHRIMLNGTNQWRVTDPDASNPGEPGNAPSDYLPNDQLSFNVGDLQGAIRAEAVIDVWGGHPGTIGRKFRLNNRPWRNVPMLATTGPDTPGDPNDGPECFVQQYNVVVNVPLSDLNEGTNVLEGDSGRQTCHNFNWGQWGWYSFTLRVYYNASKPHPTGSITSPRSGDLFSEHPVVQAATGGSVATERVEFLAYYDGYDTDGDGKYVDYHHSYHKGKQDNFVETTQHVGTATSGPYRKIWNTDLVPDQPAGGIKMVARIKGTNGVWFVTDEVTDLTLFRTDRSIKLYKPQNVPDKFWTRQNRRVSSNVSIPNGDDLGDAVSAKLMVRTWNGGTDGVHYTKVNGWTAPDYGANHYYSYDVLNMPPAELRNGSNTIEFRDNTTHHGIEILWPGPAVLVEYAFDEPIPLPTPTPTPTPTPDSNLDSGKTDGPTGEAGNDPNSNSGGENSNISRIEQPVQIDAIGCGRIGDGKGRALVLALLLISLFGARGVRGTNRRHS